MIPRIPMISIEPRPLNERLWTLFALSAEGKATPAHKRELDALCGAIETGQDVQSEREAWLPVEGYEGKYEVSSFGRVRSLHSKHGAVLKPYVVTSGYPTVRLYGDNGCKAVPVHRLVATAFVSNPSGKPYVNHLDGNKQNSRSENLEWVTNGENVVHAYRTGLNLGPRGSKQGSSVLIEDQVRQICRRVHAGDRAKDIAPDYGVASSYINAIARGDVWAWFTVPEGLIRPKRGLSEVQKAEAIERHKNGESCVAIAADMGVHNSTISRLTSRIWEQDR